MGSKHTFHPIQFNRFTLFIVDKCEPNRWQPFILSKRFGTFSADFNGIWSHHFHICIKSTIQFNKNVLENFNVKSSQHMCAPHSRLEIIYNGTKQIFAYLFGWHMCEFCVQIYSHFFFFSSIIHYAIQ